MTKEIVNRNNLIIYISVIILFHITAHYLPFERASIAPDDYGYLLRIINLGELKLSNLLLYFKTVPDRPLNMIFLDLQNYLILGDTTISLYFVLISTSLLTLLAFIFFSLLFNNYAYAFILTLLYDLFPGKLEIFHTLIFFNINFVFFIYILSLVSFLLFARFKKSTYFFISLICYCIGIFWYEAGFFIPLIMIIILLIYRKNELNLYYILKLFSPFFFVAFFYLIYRLTWAFGFAESVPGRQPDIMLIPQGIMDIINTYFGRYMLRSITYGIFKFKDIFMPLLLFLIILDLIVAFIIYYLIKNIKLKKIDNDIMIIGISIFFISIIPNIIAGAVGGRHSAIALIGFIIFIYWLIEKFGRYWINLFIFSILLGLIVTQGNAWSQVIASRINGSVYETIKENKSSLINAENIVIDTGSFANNISFSLVENNFNVLNTYYGAQTFEDWGLESMVKIVLGKDYQKKNIYISTKEIKSVSEDSYKITVSDYAGYRAVNNRNIELPSNQTFVVDYYLVYKSGYNNGKRL